MGRLRHDYGLSPSTRCYPWRHETSGRRTRPRPRTTKEGSTYDHNREARKEDGRRAPGHGTRGAQGGAAHLARHLGSGPRSPRPAHPAARSGRRPHGRPRAHPLGPHVGLAVCLLPRFGGAHGRRPRSAAAHRPHRAALRRRPPLELRPVRLTRTRAALRRERLRRDAARSVRMGPQAPGGELHPGEPQQRLRARTWLARPPWPPCAPTAST